MYRKIVFYSIALLILTNISHAINQSEIQILLPTTYHGNELPEKTSVPWFGIFKMNDGFEMRRSDIVINTVRDDVVDSGPDSVKTGKQVVVEGIQVPIFLVSGMTLNKKLISAVYSKENIKLNETIEIEFSGQKYILSTSGNVKGDATKNFKVELNLGTQKQILVAVDSVTAESMGEVNLIWAGDLDGDSKLDLVLSPIYENNVSLIELYLSSMAEKKPGQILKKVAQLRQLGC